MIIGRDGFVLHPSFRRGRQAIVPSSVFRRRDPRLTQRQCRNIALGRSVRFFHGKSLTITSDVLRCRVPDIIWVLKWATD